jgi:DNA polymerase-3 subunit delta
LPIKLNQLQQSLAQSIAPVYLIAGAEPLLVQEGREMVINAAASQGYAERELLVAEPKFDWDNELMAAGAPSLFTQQKVIDLHLASGRPGKTGAQALVSWCENPVPDTVLVLSFGSWEAASRKAKWSKTIDQAGVVVEVWPLKANELPGWISQRMAAAGLSADQDAIAMLAELVEGNLLAAQQEIDKLAMLRGGENLSAADIEGSVVNSSRFDGFRLAECVLRGEAAECLRVSAGLQRNDVAIQPVSAALYSELALVGGLLEVQQEGGDERTFFSRARVWPMRQGPMKMAARRLTQDQLGKAFRSLATIDMQGKGQAPGNAWRTLDELVMFLCNPRDARMQLRF